MTMKFADLGGLAAHLLTVTADLKLAEEVCVEKACRMIEKEAKAAPRSQAEEPERGPADNVGSGSI